MECGEKGKIAILEQRLAAASKKMQHKPKSSIDNVAFRVLTDLSAGLCVGLFIGHNLDIKFNSKPVFSLILMVLGTVGGFYNFYKLEFKKVLEEDD